MATRPGIRRSRVRTPQLALAELHDRMGAERLAAERTQHLGQKLANRLRSWFFARVRSLAGRHLKAGL